MWMQWGWKDVTGKLTGVGGIYGLCCAIKIVNDCYLPKTPFLIIWGTHYFQPLSQ